MDLALTIQRQVIAELRSQHLGEQCGAGATASDRQGGAGAWVIASYARHDNFARTCRITRNDAGP
jgi:hypothetical protein